MDWQAAVEWRAAALRRIVSSLVAMVGRGTDDELRPPDAVPADRPTLSRRRHRALTRVLRPVEAAARRLVIVLALAVHAAPQAQADAADRPAADLPKAQKGRPRRAHAPRQPVAASTSLASGTRSGIVIRHLRDAHPTFGIAVGSLVGPAPVPAWAIPPAPKPPRRLRLPLTDPLRRTSKRRSAPRSRPSIWFPGSEAERAPAWRAPRPDDRLDATRLMLRIEALADALDDLNGEAKRFLRWRARRAAERARDRRAEALAPEDTGYAPGETPAAHARRMSRRFRRVGPLRLGRPPGGRTRRKDEIFVIRDELNAQAHGLLARYDTS